MCEPGGASVCTIEAAAHLMADIQRVEASQRVHAQNTRILHSHVPLRDNNKQTPAGAQVLIVRVQRERRRGGGRRRCFGGCLCWLERLPAVALAMGGPRRARDVLRWGVAWRGRVPDLGGGTRSDLLFCRRGKRGSCSLGRFCTKIKYNRLGWC